ncbi:hypothetical protein Q5752_006565 [Cryptotrichosporon argae]
MSERTASSRSRGSNGSRGSTRSGGSRASHEDTPSQVVSEPGPSAKRRTRVLMTRFQGQGLTRLWNQTKFPSAQDREQLANDIGLKPRQVQVWFQNQRQKSRRQMAQLGQVSTITPDDLGEGSSRCGGSSSASSYLTTCSALSTPYHPSHVAGGAPSSATSRLPTPTMPPRHRSYTDDPQRYPSRPPPLYGGGYGTHAPSPASSFATNPGFANRPDYESPPATYSSLYSNSSPFAHGPPPIQAYPSHERPPPVRSHTYDALPALREPTSWPDPRTHRQHAHIPSFGRTPHSPPPTAPVSSTHAGSPPRRRHTSLEPEEAKPLPSRRPTHLPPSLSALVLDRPVTRAEFPPGPTILNQLPAVDLLSPPPSSRSFGFGAESSRGLDSRSGLESRSSALSAATDSRSLQTAGSDETFMPPAAFRRRDGDGDVKHEPDEGTAHGAPVGRPTLPSIRSLLD